jgi:Ankyrin repeat
VTVGSLCAILLSSKTPLFFSSFRSYKFGDTPLHLAVQSASWEVASILIAMGASMFEPNKVGNEAIHTINLSRIGGETFPRTCAFALQHPVSAADTVIFIGREGRI